MGWVGAGILGILKLGLGEYRGKMKITWFGGNFSHIFLYSCFQNHGKISFLRVQIFFYRNDFRN